MIKNKMNVYNFSHFFKFKIYYIIFILQQIEVIISEECSREKPIRLVNDSCVMKYCSISQYKSKECIIENKIIKIQFPNDIIFIGEKSFPYLNFLTLSNGDFLFQTSSYPGSNKRIFYGLKSNGRSLFTKYNNNEENPFYSLHTSYDKYESANSFFYKDGKEYFLSIGILETSAEIFDYESKAIISNKSNLLIGFKYINRRADLVKIDTNSYILSGSKNISSSLFHSVIVKFNLYLADEGYLYSSDIVKKEQNNSFSQYGSCFKTNISQIIICFYGYRNNDNNIYSITAFTKNLTFLKEEKITDSEINDQDFRYFYSLYFKEDGGAFTYYNKLNDSLIFFKKYNKDNGNIENIFPDIKEIKLNRIYINNAFSVQNDIIRISDNKIVFFTISQNCEILYIITNVHWISKWYRFFI